jgi:pimeloyl-ACP methyl ester carboxylesterase
MADSDAKIFKFEQPLDHFNSSVNQTWQRYQVNDDQYEKGGPIFVMISGEGTLAPKWLYSGQMFQNGRQHKALMFQLEHRFYGQSHPTKDVSVENLRYLSSHQALADLDNFIQAMKQKYDPDARVAVFGGSYSGNLVVWYRALYPNSSVAAIASSAPVLAEVDFTEYVETVGNSMKYFNPGCYDAVNDAMSAVQDLVAAQNATELDRLFGLCHKTLNFSDPYEIESLYDALTEAWMGTTQYNSPGDTSKLAMYCKLMTHTDFGTPLDRYALWFNLTSGGDCIDVNYHAEIEGLKDESWTSDAVQGGSRQWLWQTCTEFAYYQSMDSKSQPFGYRAIDVSYLEDIYCVEPFGITAKAIADSVNLTNQKYGGKAPNATRVFLMNGSIDPWHPLAIYEHDLNKDAPSRYIEGTSHCYDMHDALPTDPPQLTKARADAAAQLTEWLGPDPPSSAATMQLSVLAVFFAAILALMRM